MKQAKEQNVKIKPFKWADLTLVVQFDFCPKCRLFESCYSLKELSSEYERPCTIKGSSNYISSECGDDINK